MKANRKFIEKEAGVSAVIGVILMVAITVAIAATVFVYVNQMATPTAAGKTMGAIYESKNNTALTVTYKVTSADAGMKWGDVDASCSQGLIWLEDTDGDTLNTSAAAVSVGDFFVVNCQAHESDTYSFDLIYDEHIIWTSPAVVLS